MAGNPRGQMHGIAFAPKDIYCTAETRLRTRANYVADFHEIRSRSCSKPAPSCSASSRAGSV